MKNLSSWVCTGDVTNLRPDGRWRTGRYRPGSQATVIFPFSPEIQRSDGHISPLLLDRTAAASWTGVDPCVLCLVPLGTAREDEGKHVFMTFSELSFGVEHLSTV